MNFIVNSIVFSGRNLFFGEFMPKLLFLAINDDSAWKKNRCEYFNLRNFNFFNLI